VAPGYLQFLSDQIDLIESWGAGWTADFGIYTGAPWRSNLHCLDLGQGRRGRPAEAPPPGGLTP
jgi:hypothetical protein